MQRWFMSVVVVTASVGLCQLAGAESLTTADKKSIDITYYPAPADHAPVVILIPDTRCDRSVFQKLPLQLAPFGADLGKSSGDNDHGTQPACGAVIDHPHDRIAWHGNHR